MDLIFKILFIITLSSIGFSLMNCSKDTADGLSNEGKALYGFQARAGKRIGEKYGISPCGVGGGAKDGIWLMSLDFQRYGSFLTREEARRLMIACLNDFLEEVNNDEKLRPFLKFHPFKVENTDMTIFVYTPTGEEALDPHIGTISTRQGNIRYSTVDPHNQFKYKTTFEETYGEAMAILQKEKT